MSPESVRPTKNLQFEHAAAAMGAFWARTRRNKARRARRIRQMFVEASRAVVNAASGSTAGSPAR